LTEAVIGLAFTIANVLGEDFQKEPAQIRELTLHGVNAKAYVTFPVCYKNPYTLSEP
jgi:hypothetical protein